MSSLGHFADDFSSVKHRASHTDKTVALVLHHPQEAMQRAIAILDETDRVVKHVATMLSERRAHAEAKEGSSYSPRRRPPTSLPQVRTSLLLIARAHLVVFPPPFPTRYAAAGARVPEQEQGGDKG